MPKNEKYKVRDHSHCTWEYIGAVHSTYNLKYSIPKEVSIVCHIDLTISRRIWKTINLFRSKHWKIYNLSVPIQKEVTRIDKTREEITKAIFYRLQFIDSARYMASSLSSRLNDLTEGIHEIKSKYKHNDQKCKTFGIKYKDWDCFLEYTNIKGDLIEYKCLCCNNNYENSFMKIQRNHLLIHTNFNHDIIYFIVANSCLFIWIHGWSGKNWWNTITWKRRSLQSPKYGRCYWCRLHTCKNIF